MADTLATPPLSPQERAKVYTILAAADTKLADRVAEQLDERDDPLIRVVTDTMQSVSAQLRQYLFVTVGVSVVAMCLNVALVGVSINLRGAWGSFTTQGAGTSAPAPAPAFGPTNPAPDPTLPRPEP